MHKMIAGPIWVAWGLVTLVACSKDSPKNTSPDAYPLATGVVEEASGIADSRLNAGMLWVQEDSGNPPELHLLSHQGQLLRSLTVTGAANIDWEDLALAPGPAPSLYYLYIGDIGDNDQKRDQVSILRGAEVSSTATSIVTDNIRIQYADGAHDAEAFIVEPETLDIYILTKRDAKSGIYKLTYPYSTTVVNTARKVGELPYNFVVSAALRADGRGLAVKDYVSIRYYPRTPGESIADVLKKTPSNLPYQMEQQGEAICFTLDGSYYFTLSEKLNAPVALMRYKF